MIEPDWITLDEAEQIHEEQIAEHGGLTGTRDQGRLEAAMARPVTLFGYTDASLSQLAATYAHGIAMGHPFIDGNKRTSFVVAVTFLAVNDVEIDAETADVHETWTRLAAGEIAEADLVVWFQDHAAR